jgi:hypothetical protein
MLVNLFSFSSTVENILCVKTELETDTFGSGSIPVKNVHAEYIFSPLSVTSAATFHASMFSHTSMPKWISCVPVQGGLIHFEERERELAQEKEKRVKESGGIWYYSKSGWRQ